MPLLATVGNRVSQLLHHVVFSFPSPGNVTIGAFKLERVGGEEVDPAEGGLNGLIAEPGESRAMANGVGPLSFAGSGYGVMLVLTAILLNRIHHIVRRANPPIPPMPHPPVTSWYWRMRLALVRTLTSPEMPRYLRLPGLVCLGRAWALLTILTLQVANLWPVHPPKLLGDRMGHVLLTFGNWAGEMEMEKACWQVFLSVCAGLVCSGLANGLDRARRRDVGAGFNLFGFSFLLHLYSSPLTHHRPPPAAMHGRPDAHAMFQLWLSLTELTWLQALELSPSLRRNQLLPTAVCGTMGLTHFVYALLTAPLRFPSFTFLTHLLALFLSIVIAFSIVVKALTHIFTLGYIPSPILASLLPHDGAVPSIEDDFGVALLKLGTSCLEATQYSGLRNELVSVEERQGPWVEIGAAGSSVKHLYSAGGFGNEITEVDVSEPEGPRRESAQWREFKLFWQTFWQCVLTYLHTLILSTPGGKKAIELAIDAWHRQWWYGPRSWAFWRREAWTVPLELRREQILRRIRVIERQRLARLAENTGTSTALAPSLHRRSRQSTPTPVPYAEFLRGEVELEDDEEDWEDGDADSLSSGSASEDEELSPAIYRDLLNEQTEATPDLQPVLLAHLTSHSSSPLTRRRYRALLAPAPLPDLDMQQIVHDRRMAVTGKERDDWDDDRRRSCVVCTIEPRDTILWPCRCLALCNDCRESLAARLAAKDHMCPCCRRKVDGYSRIFIP